MENKVYFAKLKNDVILPSKNYDNAGYDIYANFTEEYIVIKPNETKMIPTKLVSAFSNKYVAILKERGSTGTKGIGQRCGVIDSSFRGEWFIPITNHNNVDLYIIKSNVTVLNINKSDSTNFNRSIKYPYEKAICQCIFVELPETIIEETDIENIMNIVSTRGKGMLGSTKK